jgi:hypothetical protein
VVIEGHVVGRGVVGSLHGELVNVADNPPKNKTEARSCGEMGKTLGEGNKSGASPPSTSSTILEIKQSQERTLTTAPKAERGREIVTAYENALRWESIT